MDSDTPDTMDASAMVEVGNAVDDEIQRFKVLKMQPGSLPPRDALAFWNGSATLRFPNQVSASQIERDLGGAGQLLSSRKSRLDMMYVEMLLFLHLNFDKIP